ncbi:hypothetical protein GY45DRAFT_1322050 [Cubamyces sp. BRFM 1775]|nr:hypothetical protein GY45DRAFT_1322050 [Cubamyces sp. BRFM 1775]
MLRAILSRFLLLVLRNVCHSLRCLLHIRVGRPSRMSQFNCEGQSLRSSVLEVCHVARLYSIADESPHPTKLGRTTTHRVDSSNHVPISGLTTNSIARQFHQRH